MMSATNTIEMAGLKDKLKGTWMAGNYDYFSRFMESSAVEFLDRLPLRRGDRLLDVACGSGQLALLAAHKGAKVTGVDIATNWIEAPAAAPHPRVWPRSSIKETPRSFRIPTKASTSSRVFMEPCSPRAQSGSRRSSRASVAPAGRLRWPTGPKRDSSGECSRSSAGSLPHPECLRRSYGVTSPPYVNGSGTASHICGSLAFSTDSTTRSLRREWSISSARTMAQPIVPSPLFRRPIRSRCGTLSWSCGAEPTRARMPGALSSTRSTWMSSRRARTGGLNDFESFRRHGAAGAIATSLR